MPESSSPRSLPFVHWFLYSFGYAFVCFIAVLRLDSPRITPLLIAFLTIFVTIQLSAIWSVFGTGNFFIRALSSLAMCGIVVAGIVLGAFVMASVSSRGLAGAKAVALTFALLTPSLYCASQIPYWILRTAFGWQFVFDNRPPAPSFQLRDLFAITFLFAIAFAGLQAAGATYVSLFDGMVLIENSELTPEELAKADLAQRSAMKAGMIYGLLTYSAIFFVLSMVMVPFAFIVFRTKRAGRGILYLSATALMALIVAVIVISVQTGGLIGVFGFGSGLLSVLTLTVVAFVVPLFHTRMLGFSLVTMAQHQPTNQQPQQSSEPTFEGT